MGESGMNEFIERQDWSRRMRDKILRPFYKEHSRDGDMVFLDGSSAFIKILQKVFHADTLLTRISDGEKVVIDEKIRSRYFDDFLIETDSCTVPGKESAGWFYSKAPAPIDITLLAFVHGDENGATCFPLPMQTFRPWFELHKSEFREQMVRNPINGFEMWTRNLVVPRQRACQALRFDGFNLRGGTIVEDFWGKPRMEWLS
jgi:hypothetical protein